jgi:hypothetical protein
MKKKMVHELSISLMHATCVPHNEVSLPKVILRKDEECRSVENGTLMPVLDYMEREKH